MAVKTMTDTILSYALAAERGPSVAGGKGWNLGRLAGFGFPVPVGAVIAADVYRVVMERPEIAELRDAVAHVQAERVTEPEVTAALARLRDAVEATTLSEQVRGEIAAFLDDAGLARKPVAVRSSATLEDGRGASFAGIHGSFLGVTGLDDVCQTLLRCYATLWTPQALAYRRKLGFTDDDVACAVVICEMVGGPEGIPVAAGVAFSCDPQTGQRDRVVVDAARGLGDAVVSGAVTPEHVVVRGIPGFVGIAIERREANDRVLADDVALRLARLVRRVEWALGDGQDPQDVEWAYDGERLWLVQARPVTKVPRVTFPEVAHLPIVWSNANLKEVVSGVQTVLSWHSVSSMLKGICDAMVVGDYHVPRGMEVARRIEGRSYFDLTTMGWFAFDLYGTTPKEFNDSLGGHQPEIPIPGGFEPFVGPEGKRRKKAQLQLLRKVWRERKHYPRQIEETRATARAMREVDYAACTNTELLAHVENCGAVSAAFLIPFQFGNSCFSLWNTLLTRAIESAKPGAGQRIAAGLMAAAGGVVSAEHGYRLFDLAAVAGDRPHFEAAFAEFLDEFGHRAVNEGEFSKPRWREDPTYLLDVVASLVESGRTTPPVETARATRAAAEAEVSGFSFLRRPVIRWLAKLTREATAMRESGKSALVSLVEPGRLMAAEIGSRMQKAGAIVERDDVFHLSWHDVEAFLRGEWDGAGASALVAMRKAQREEWLAEEVEDIYILDAAGNPAELPATSSRPTAREEADADGSYLTGSGVAAGRASGVARAIRTPEEGSRLAQGEILVAPSTDPAWTPLFLRASAIVTEVGGYLSHGAIVAREYGLPAVVNVPRLLDRLPDGTPVTVDADAGRVIIRSHG